jgi:SAM-dependent methyltransferase
MIGSGYLTVDRGADSRRLAVRLAKLYLSLFPAYPPAYNFEPKPLVRASMEYDDELKEGFTHWFDLFHHEQIDFRGKRVLDLGSGYGGRTVRYKELGASQVTGLEVGSKYASEALMFSRQREVATAFVVAVGEKLPFKDDYFDIITSYEVFEHVERLSEVLEECHRVLKPGGRLYAVFPSFYNPVGGSHFHGFVSKTPAPNVFFSNKSLMNAADLILAERGDGFRPRELRPADKLWGLNGTSIRGFQQLLKWTNFSSVRIVKAPVLSPIRKKWQSWKMKYYGFLFQPLVHIPFVNEIFVDRLVCSFTK